MFYFSLKAIGNRTGQHQQQQQELQQPSATIAKQQSLRGYAEIEFPGQRYPQQQQQHQLNQRSPTLAHTDSTESQNNGYVTVYHARDHDDDCSETTSDSNRNSASTTTSQNTPPPTSDTMKPLTRLDSSFRKAAKSHAEPSNKLETTSKTEQVSARVPSSQHQHQMQQRTSLRRQEQSGQHGIIEYESIELDRNHLQQRRNELESLNFKPINNNNINTSFETTTNTTGYEDMMSASFTAGGGSGRDRNTPDMRERGQVSSPPPNLPSKGPKLPVKRSNTNSNNTSPSTPSTTFTTQQMKDGEDSGRGVQNEDIPHFIPQPKASLKSRDHRSLYENQEINLSSPSNGISTFHTNLLNHVHNFSTLLLLVCQIK